MTIRNKSTYIATTAAMAFSLAAAPAAIAQQYGAQPGAESQQQTQDYSEAQIQAYATAFLEVRDLSREYQGKMQSAETPEQQQAVQQEATELMSNAVQESGLSVQEYNNITEASRTDPDLQAKVMEKISDEQQNNM